MILIKSKYNQFFSSCGALHCGDQINAIDQKSFDGISLSDATAVLRSCTGDFCRIEVTPTNIILEQSKDIRIQSPTTRTLLNENNRQAFYRTPNITPISSNWPTRTSYQNATKKSVNKTRHNSISESKIFIRLLHRMMNIFEKKKTHQSPIPLYRIMLSRPSL